MDRGTWQATVQGVAKSYWPQLLSLSRELDGSKCTRWAITDPHRQDAPRAAPWLEGSREPSTVAPPHPVLTPGCVSSRARPAVHGRRLLGWIVETQCGLSRKMTGQLLLVCVLLASGCVFSTCSLGPPIEGEPHHVLSTTLSS